MIRKLKWNNHGILGNLELDFMKDDGTEYNTIILAGENGTGKTTILETIVDFLNGGSVEPFKYIKCVSNETPFVITPDDMNPQHGFYKRKNEHDNTISTIHYICNLERDEMEADSDDIRHYGFSYSKARSGFNTKKVNAITTQQLDLKKFNDDSNDDFTSVKQVIVDIESEVSTEWRKLSKAHSKIAYDDFESKSKAYRFANAFNKFFENLQYMGIDDSDPNEKKIIFEKDGKDISIDKLGTGEKQIVFRGTQLLTNRNNITGGTVLIDEPELSMHPKWQMKILQYYRDLFTTNGN